MLEHIKKVGRIYFLSMLPIFFLGCTDGTMTDRAKAMSKLFHMYSIGLNKKGNVVSKYNYLNKNVYQCSELVEEKWQKNKKCDTINDVNITIKNGIATYSKDNIVITNILPTIEDISDTLSIELKRSDVVYVPFVDGKNHTWDYRTYLASIGSNKKEDCNKHDSDCYEKIYYVHIENKADLWDIKLIASDVPYKDDEPTEAYMYESIDYKYMSSPSTNRGNRLVPISFKGSSPLCSFNTAYKYCFVRKEEHIKRIEFINLYREYLHPITNIKRHPDLGGVDDLRAFYMDSEDNLHIFYNDLYNLSGKYFLYEMYTKENPKVPINQQKIYWEQN